MSHANARLTPAGRREMVQRSEAGTTQTEVARQMHLSRGTVAKWWGRWCTEGEVGLADCFSQAAVSLPDAHAGCGHRASLSAAPEHPPRPGVTVSAHGSSAGGGVAYPQAQRLEPAVVDGPAHRAGDPQL